MNNEKEIRWVGTSLDDLIRFPAEVKKEAGYQLHRIQIGLNPDNWKPFNTIGAGVREIRITEGGGAYRVMYVAKFEEAIYVLHAFQKTSQRTKRSDINLAEGQYRKVVIERRGK